jgi:hypothetical protein
MPKLRPPTANLAEWRKVLHGIHRLEMRMSALEGTLRPIPQGARVINDSVGQASWVPPLRGDKQRG